MKGQVAALKSLTSYNNIGTGWNCSKYASSHRWTELTKEELKKLESIQHQELCTLLHMPKTTPYSGLLSEVGMWDMEERIMYQKIMLYQNIVQSDESRLIKKMIEEQEKESTEDIWYSSVQKCLSMINIDAEVAKEGVNSAKEVGETKHYSKNGWRNREQAKKNSTKMRFIDSDTFKMTEYVENGEGGSTL